MGASANPQCSVGRAARMLPAVGAQCCGLHNWQQKAARNGRESTMVTSQQHHHHQHHDH